MRCLTSSCERARARKVVLSVVLVLIRFQSREGERGEGGKILVGAGLVAGLPRNVLM